MSERDVILPSSVHPEAPARKRARKGSRSIDYALDLGQFPALTSVSGFRLLDIFPSAVLKVESVLARRQPLDAPSPDVLLKFKGQAAPYCAWIPLTAVPALPVAETSLALVPPDTEIPEFMSADLFVIERIVDMDFRPRDKKAEPALCFCCVWATSGECSWEPQTVVETLLSPEAVRKFVAAYDYDGVCAKEKEFAEIVDDKGPLSSFRLCEIPKLLKPEERNCIETMFRRFFSDQHTILMCNSFPNMTASIISNYLSAMVRFCSRGPFLVVCDNATFNTWHSELRNFAIGVRLQVINASNRCIVRDHMVSFFQDKDKWDAVFPNGFVKSSHRRTANPGPTRFEVVLTTFDIFAQEKDFFCSLVWKGVFVESVRKTSKVERCYHTLSSITTQQRVFMSKERPFKMFGEDALLPLFFLQKSEDARTITTNPKVLSEGSASQAAATKLLEDVFAPLVIRDRPEIQHPLVSRMVPSMPLGKSALNDSDTETEDEPTLRTAQPISITDTSTDKSVEENRLAFSNPIESKDQNPRKSKTTLLNSDDDSSVCSKGSAGTRSPRIPSRCSSNSSTDFNSDALIHGAATCSFATTVIDSSNSLVSKRNRKDVGKTYKEVFVPCPTFKDESEVYRKMLQERENELADVSSFMQRKRDLLAFVRKLLSVLNCGYQTPHAGNILDMKDRCGKLFALHMLLSRLIDERRKIVLVCSSTSSFELLKSYLSVNRISFESIGAMNTPTERIRATNRFNIPLSDMPVMLLCAHYNFVGEEMFFADTIVTYDTDLTRRVESKQLSRIMTCRNTYRNPEAPVFILRLFSARTIEESLTVLTESQQSPFDHSTPPLLPSVGQCFVALKLAHTMLPRIEQNVDRAFDTDLVFNGQLRAIIATVDRIANQQSPYAGYQWCKVPPEMLALLKKDQRGVTDEDILKNDIPEQTHVTPIGIPVPTSPVPPVVAQSPSVPLTSTIISFTWTEENKYDLIQHMYAFGTPENPSFLQPNNLPPGLRNKSQNDVRDKALLLLEYISKKSVSSDFFDALVDDGVREKLGVAAGNMRLLYERLNELKATNTYQPTNLEHCVIRAAVVYGMTNHSLYIRDSEFFAALNKNALTRRATPSELTPSETATISTTIKRLLHNIMQSLVLDSFVSTAFGRQVRHEALERGHASHSVPKTHRKDIITWTTNLEHSQQCMPFKP